MAKKTALARVEEDIARGDLGKARDRLHGLIRTRPNDLSLRRRLGEIYQRLQFPSMAGRYWYLEEDKTPEMEEACRAFERSCGGAAFVIFRCLKFKGNVLALDCEFARAKLVEIGRRAGVDVFHSGLRTLSISQRLGGRLRPAFFGGGCAVVLLILAIALFLGVAEMVSFVADFLRH